MDRPVSPLKKEFDYYLKNQETLAKKHGGKVIVIKDEKVMGVFDTEFEAVEKTSPEHEPGSFLVQKCDSGEVCHTQTFHSRVAFRSR
jgi:hypothetical protein